MLRRAPSLLAWTLYLGACEGQRPLPSPAVTPPPGTVTQMADGSLRLQPPPGDMAVLRLRPDGSYQRVCGAPSPEVRAMMDGVRRARRAAR